jgi:hypothetical protein
MKAYHSQFDPNKTYNTKTLSLDGSKIVREENTKYLFGFRENSQSQVEQFFFDKTYMKYFKEKGITFQDMMILISTQK